VIVLTTLSAIIGSYGVLSVNNLTQVTLISNIGTFLLYGMTCLICVVAFAGVAGRNAFSTVIAPILGAVLNILMLIGVIYYAVTSSGASQVNTLVAGVIAIVWLILGFAYLYIRQAVSGIPILHPPDHKEKVGGSIDEAVAATE
jgi:hypothetical protein